MFDWIRNRAHYVPFVGEWLPNDCVAETLGCKTCLQGGAFPVINCMLKIKPISYK